MSHRTKQRPASDGYRGDRAYLSRNWKYAGDDLDEQEAARNRQRDAERIESYRKRVLINPDDVL